MPPLAMAMLTAPVGCAMLSFAVRRRNQVLLRQAMLTFAVRWRNPVLVSRAMLSNATFAVHRRNPVLVSPARPTPRVTKRLSDIDDQEVLRHLLPIAFFYRGGMAQADDPAAVVRRALREALVPYYPLAGRLREVEARKLVVDHTGEGVMFVEADADVRLAELEAAGLRPPFPCFDPLLLQVQDLRDVMNCPLLLIQVTRLLCGGFVLAVRFNHTLCDGIGIVQFLSAVAELARGGPGDHALTVAPVWCRELLEARRPPKPPFPHREFDAVPVPVPPPPPPGDMVMRTFTFGPADVAAIKRGLPPGLAATTFEALTAALWRARTAALEVPADEEVRLVPVVGFRGLPELGLPAGYYGNAFVPVAAVTTAGKLLAGSLGDAAGLVREAKAAVTADYVRSTVDLLVLRGRPLVALANLWLVSDARNLGFRRVDFGWGEPVYCGPADAFFQGSFIMAVRNGADGKDTSAAATCFGMDQLAVPVVLPQQAMDRFASERSRR